MVLSNKMMSVSTVFAGSGGMAPPFIVGRFIDENPMILMYACTVIACILTGIMAGLYVKWFMKIYKRKCIEHVVTTSHRYDCMMHSSNKLNHYSNCSNVGYHEYDDSSEIDGQLIRWSPQQLQWRRERREEFRRDGKNVKSRKDSFIRRTRCNYCILLIWF